MAAAGAEASEGGRGGGVGWGGKAGLAFRDCWGVKRAMVTSPFSQALPRLCRTHGHMSPPLLHPS